MLNIARVYEKRATDKSAWDGRVGAVEMTADVRDGDIVVTVNGKELPRTSVEYLLNFSLQSLQDAYAGAESLDEAQGNWSKKLDALIAGSIGIRSGEGVSTETSVARSIVRALLKNKYGAKSTEWKDFTALEDKAANAKLDEMYEKNREKLEPAVKKEMERRRNEAAAKKAIMEDIAL